MRAGKLVLIGCAAACSMFAAEREFKDVVRSISDEFQTKPVHIPMMGLANVALKFVHPAGAKHVDFAIFQDLEPRRGRNLKSSIRHAVGDEWQPFVTVHSERGRSDADTLVYMKGHGDDVTLLVVTLDRDQAVVVEARVDPKELRKWVDNPEDMARHWRGGPDSGRSSRTDYY